MAIFRRVDDRLTPFSRALKDEIDARRGPSKRGTPRQEEIAAAVGRTQPYVSSRINGEFPWSTNDLDLLAPLFGETAFTLIESARARMRLANLDERRTKDVGAPGKNEKAVAKAPASDRGEE